MKYHSHFCLLINMHCSRKDAFFSQKALIFNLFLHENICYGYSLEAPYQGASIDYPQCEFSWRNKKKSYADTFYYLGLCKGKAFFYLPGLWKYHAQLVQLVPFPWGQEISVYFSWNKDLLVLAKKGIQSMKYIFFLFLEENICCLYSLEAPHQGASSENSQHMFSARNEIKVSIFWQVNLCWTSGFWPFTCLWTGNKIW